MAIVAIIPARYASTRLPGKPLCDIHGKPMIQLVCEQVARARLVDRLLVATDDERIADAVRGFGGEAVMTSTQHASGTDRVAEAIGGIDADLVVNVQGDEPMLDPAAIDTAVAAIREDDGLAMATLCTDLYDAEEMLSPNSVKVVVDGRGDALYFSRAPIPFVRGDAEGEAGAREAVARGIAAKHLGLYVYTREAIERLASLPPAPLERAEGLEQLRALHHGLRIRVAPFRAPRPTVAVDTVADLQRVRALLAGVPAES